MSDDRTPTAVVVGAGFAGIGAARELAKHGVRVVLLERNDYHQFLPHQYRSLAVRSASVHLVDHAHTLLGPFSDRAHDYAAKVLQRKGVRLHLGTGVVEITPDKVVLSDGTVLTTRTVIWAGGVMAASLAERTGLPLGRGGRIAVEHDLTVEDVPGVYAVGDVANVPAPDGTPYRVHVLGLGLLQHQPHPRDRRSVRCGPHRLGRRGRRGGRGRPGLRGRPAAGRDGRPRDPIRSG